MPYSYYAGKILAPILITFLPAYACAYCITSTTNEGFARLLLTTTATTAVYMLMIYRWGVTQQEREIFIQLINKIKKKAYGTAKR